MRLLVFLAVVVTIIAILYYYHPSGNVIDYFSNLKTGTTTGTTVNPAPQSSGGTPFSSLAVSPDGSSPLQAPAPAPAPNPPPQPVAPASPPRMPKSARDKIYKMAADNDVTILQYNEPQIGQVTLTCQAKDKNDIFSFQDALLKFGIRDFDEIKGTFRLQMDPNGRTIVTDSFKIRYIPDY